MRASIAIVVAALIACGPPSREGTDATAPGDDTVDASVTSDACKAAEQERSYIGCTYWPVDLANAIEVMGPPQGASDCSTFGTAAVMLPVMDVCVNNDGTYAGRCDPPGGTCPTGATCEQHAACGLDAQHSPYAIIVANVGDADADVTLADATGMSVTRSVAARQTLTLSPQALGFADHSIDAAGIAAAAYKLTSTRPVVAYQFNPLDDVGVFSNDASLLLPQQTFDTSYMNVTFANTQRRPASSEWRGYMTIVATQDTNVEVTPTVTAIAGATTITANTAQSFALKKFETLQIVALVGDLTGTRVTSDKPIGAYGGHEATFIQDPFPFRGPCCADHLEEQLYPTSTWGTQYAVGRGRERAAQIHDLVRIVAQKPNTVVQITPDQGGFSNCGGLLLQPGKFCDVYINQDVEVRANEPVLLGHFMVSGGGISPQSGDPALAFVPPVAQFRESYTIVVPQQYNANDLTLVAPAGSQVYLDGADISLLLTPFGTNTYSAARVGIAPGPHEISCPMGCSVEVSGYNTAVSYLYSGGLDLAAIVL